MSYPYDLDEKYCLNKNNNLYRWAKTFNKLQRSFFQENVKLRREKQIEDFVKFNGFSKIYPVTDTDVFFEIKNKFVTAINQADLVIITDQKFSRYTCPIIIDKIKQTLEQCPNLYLCLNSNYINIDNSYHDQDLDDNFNLAITQWLKKKLNCNVLDLSLDVKDDGRGFSWAIPNKHYFIWT